MATWKFIIRSVLFFLDLAMLLAALALIAVGFWMGYDSSFDTDLKNVIYKYDDPKSLADAKFNIRVWLIVVFWSIIGLSLGAVVTAVLGMISSVWPKRKGFMITYLVLIIVLVSLEIGCGVAVLVRRNSLHDNTNSLIDAMYTTNSVNDLKIIQDKPHCDVAVFDSVDNTMMISGIILLVILILQTIAIILPVPILISRKKTYKYSYEPRVTQLADITEDTRF